MIPQPKPRGRPPLPPEQRRESVLWQARLSPEQRAKLQRLGGAVWLRERIDRARGE